MSVLEILSTAREGLTARPVYGEPYEKNGVTVIPAASVRGGGGGGGGKGHGDGGDGAGGGFGLAARPVGAWIVRGEDVTWKPAVDVGRIMVGWQLVALAFVLVGGAVARAHARRRTPIETAVSTMTPELRRFLRARFDR